MKRLSQYFIVRSSILQVLRGLPPDAQRRASRAHLFSWNHLRYALALLSALLLTFTAFPLLSNQAHANQTYVAATAFDDVLCGSDAQFPGNTTWAPITAGTTAYEPDGTVVQAVGYQGGSGSLRLANNCSGNYHYGLDQYYHLAQWKFSALNNGTSLPNAYSQCSMSVFVPSWYAGAPDAQYTLTIAGTTTDTLAFDTFNQNQNSSGWYTLTVNGQSQFPLSFFPASGSNYYNFTFTLRNGGGQGGQWYLAADAIHFTCNS